MTGSLWELALAAAVFVGGHFVLSSTPLRAAAVRRIGEPRFKGLFSLLMVAALVWMISAFNAAPEVIVWQPNTAARHVSLSVMPFALIFLIASLTPKNPALGGTIEAIRKGPAGIFKITRHPMLWGFALWGTVHLLANGDAAGMIMFSAFTGLALAGTLAVDRKTRIAMGADWDGFARRTSNLPFAAIIGGRARVGLREIGYWRIAGGLALYVAILLVHKWAFGVTPLRF